MKIPRMTVITLGVDDLAKSTAFYRDVLAVEPDTSNDGVTFIPLPGVWLSLFPLAHLAQDISPDIKPVRSGFAGFTLAHNVRNKEDVQKVLERAEAAGALIVKEAQDTFWGGFSGYFTDLDGNYWEIVWGPMFDFSESGELLFQSEG